MPNATGRQVSGLLWGLRGLTLLHEFLASRLNSSVSLTIAVPSAPVDAMKLPINPDSETAQRAANHLCRTLFRPMLQLMSFQALAWCCHRDRLLTRKFTAALRDDRRAPSNVKRRRGKKRIISALRILKKGYIPGARTGSS